MLQTYLNRALWWTVLVLLQVFFFNHIHLFGYATPFIYLYIVVKLSSDISRHALMLWAFLLGLLIDVFSDTPGMNAAAAVFLAFLRPTLLRLFVPRDTNETFTPSIHTMGLSSFVKYLSMCVIFHHLLLFTIAFFSLSSPLELLMRILSSALLTVCCLLAVEGLQQQKSNP
ncbi:MAG: rod shape-determining protein MreD [Bacteroides sp.]